MKNPDTLPVIIRDLIENIEKDGTPAHIRDVYAQRLENIVECASEVLSKYRTRRMRMPMGGRKS